MSSSVSFPESFTLSRWLHCPPASLEEQRLAVRSIQSLTIHLQGIIEEQCDEKLTWRRPESYEVFQAHEAHQGQLHQQRQDQYPPEEHQEHQEQRKEQEEQEEQEEQNRQEQQQWEATQTLCGPLADLQGDFIASPSPQASNMPSTTVTAPAPILPNFGLPTAEAQILEPQTDNPSARHLPQRPTPYRRLRSGHQPPRRSRWHQRRLAPVRAGAGGDICWP
ncbi:hypothetical protein GJ744_003327 [Endocarpon pusillum]|uniref:Uncharacterized protein n=1 Tax=Endocarpon pusillum TaxID=364733 RepID=A0A8H7A990_9EURO|nr:hypothetical protein GJ744_003327 [Endocarpon pusillum]